MPINLPDLPNGLKQINTGVTPGDRQGDPIRVCFDKVNLNSSLSLTENDNLAGAGLAWDPNLRKLSFNGPSNSVLIGSSFVGLGAEFSVVNGNLRVGGVDGSTITGAISPLSLSLTTRQVVIGSGARGAAYALGSEFATVGNELKITSLGYSSITGVAVTPPQMTLANRVLPVGTSGGVGGPVTLGPDFAIANGILSLTVSNQLVTLGSINATGASVGRVLAIKGPSNAMSLEWVDVAPPGGGGTGSVGLTGINTTNQSTAQAVLQVTPNGQALEWQPDLRNRIESSMRGYINFLGDQQRRVNLDYSRSIAELQNQSCQVYNYPLPAGYTANITQTQKPVEVPGAAYIVGGQSANGFKRTFERLDFTTETSKVISNNAPADAISGEKYDGMHKSKDNTATMASPSNMYVAGMGSVPGTDNPAVEAWSWQLEKFNFSKQAWVVAATTLGGVRPRGAATVHDYKEGYFVGGLLGTAANTNTFLTSIENITFLLDTISISSLVLSGSDTVYLATGESHYSSGAGKSVGFIFGGRNASQTFATIRKLTMGALPTLVNSSTTLSNHRIGAASFSDASFAYLWGGGTTLNQSASGLASRMRFSTEAVELISVDLLTNRWAMTGSASATKGYLFGGYEKLAASTIQTTYVEQVPVWSERNLPTIKPVVNFYGAQDLPRFNG
jgi:hypothetical protein